MVQVFRSALSLCCALPLRRIMDSHSGRYHPAPYGSSAEWPVAKVPKLSDDAMGASALSSGGAGHGQQRSEEIPSSAAPWASRHAAAMARLTAAQERVWRVEDRLWHLEDDQTYRSDSLLWVWSVFKTTISAWRSRWQRRRSVQQEQPIHDCEMQQEHTAAAGAEGVNPAGSDSVSLNSDDDEL